MVKSQFTRGTQRALWDPLAVAAVAYLHPPRSIPFDLENPVRMGERLAHAAKRHGLELWEGGLNSINLAMGNRRVVLCASYKHQLLLRWRRATKRSGDRRRKLRAALGHIIAIERRSEPLLQVSHLPKEPNAMQPSSPKSVILCVDDDAVALRVRALVLSSAGYEVVSASNVNEALEILRTRPIDLVITDHLLPGSTGAELAAHIKHHQPDIPIALLSGLSEPPEGAEYADIYLFKGMGVPEFLAAVRTLFPQRRLAE
jgi:CheY-like chemotaxis protein